MELRIRFLNRLRRDRNRDGGRKGTGVGTEIGTEIGGGMGDRYRYRDKGGEGVDSSQRSSHCVLKKLKKLHEVKVDRMKQERDKESLCVGVQEREIEFIAQLFNFNDFFSHLLNRMNDLSVTVKVNALWNQVHGPQQQLIKG